jgi:hypothetical protein
VNVAANRRLLAIVTDVIGGEGAIAEIRKQGNGQPVELRLIVPAVEATAFRHTMGDIDEPREQAEERLAASLEALRADGIEVTGGVGDPDPIQAAQDALLEAPADEVLIFEQAGAHAGWYEDGLFERAQENIEPPLRMVVLENDGEGDEVVEVEKAGRGTIAEDVNEVGSAYLPGLSRADLAGMVAGVVGTIVTIILAAAISSGGAEVGWEAVAILIAIGIALVNMAHVVGLTLFESVRYRGGFAKFFRTLALVGTPLAVLANLLILLFA